MLWFQGQLLVPIVSCNCNAFQTLNYYVNGEVGIELHRFLSYRENDRMEAGKVLGLGQYLVDHHF